MLAEKIRENPRLADATIMMLTSGGRLGEAARCRELGVSSYLTKPVSQMELLAALLRATGSKSVRKEPGTAARKFVAGDRSLRILLAEDNLVNQRLALRLLERRGHRVVVARDGEEVLAALETGAFDLVLMDVQMPGMDGLAAPSAIREKEKSTGEHLPIVAMTASAMQRDQEICLAAGMDGYIAKPINADALFEILDAQIAPK